jgi:hypothetical protein
MPFQVLYSPFSDMSFHSKPRHEHNSLSLYYTGTPSNYCFQEPETAWRMLTTWNIHWLEAASGKYFQPIGHKFFSYLITDLISINCLILYHKKNYTLTTDQITIPFITMVCRLWVQTLAVPLANRLVAGTGQNYQSLQF